MMSNLEISELPELKATDVAWRNGDLKFFSTRIYQFAGLQLRFERLEEAPASSANQGSGAWLSMNFGGQALVLKCSQACVQALLQAQGWSLEGLSEEALDLMGQTRLAPCLPAGVMLQRVSLASSGVALNELQLQGTWLARHATTQELSDISISIWAPAGFAIYAFFGVWDAWLARQDKPRLSGLPWTMPLVCARWKTEASDLQGLAVGDVLLIDA